MRHKSTFAPGQLRIGSKQYTLLWDYDRAELLKAKEQEQIQWLKRRIEFILLGPLRRMRNNHLQGEVVLLYATAICAGISAMGRFLVGAPRRSSKGKPREKDAQTFARFVREYMGPAFRKRIKTPRGKITRHAWIYSYLRCGLAHMFGVAFGGLEIDTINKPPLLFRTTVYGPEIEPLLFFDDFERAVERYFADLEQAAFASLLRKRFRSRFRHILQFEK